MSYFNEIRTNYAQFGVDAGARTRVSQITTLFDGQIQANRTNLLFAQTGSGTIVSDGVVSMTVSPGQYCINQSRKTLAYSAGKSQLIECTFDTFCTQSGVVKRVGYFNSSTGSADGFSTKIDGMYLESSGSSINFVVKNEDTTNLNISMSQWSGYNQLAEYQNPSAWDNFTVVAFDFLWLGGAVVRLWVKTSQGFVLAHIFNYSGTQKGTMIKYPSRPLRYEIRSTTGTGHLNYICSQVATEGSIEENSTYRAVDTGPTPIVAATAGTIYPIKAIRKSKEFRHVPVSIAEFNVFVSTINDISKYSAILNPTLSAPLTYTSVPSSSIEEANGNGTITVTPGTGHTLVAGYVTQNSIIPSGILKNNFLSDIGSDVDGDSDEYVLCIQPTTGVSNVSTFGAISFREY